MHHANIILGGNKKFIFELLEKELNFKAHQNPDFLFIESQSFGIEEARSLEKWAIGKSLSGEIKVALLDIGAITFEAQNALLKVLEEPTVGTYFFIVVENLGNILPTLLSRVQILELNNVDHKNDNADDKFLRANIKERLALIRALAKKEEKTDLKNLIKSLESVARQNKFPASSMKNILLAKVFVSTRGASPKMLLEWLSCVI